MLLTIQEAVWEVDTQIAGSGSAAVALALLAAELKAQDRVQPGKNCGNLFSAASRPPLPPQGVLCGQVAWTEWP